ncbi:hypothetical protein M408DRAFT_19816 [Serendipita vermifera MAFF 305830]|uniref:Zn(2)-C6 fungal-type domain-containing protein n=1 Tax=Serendipita vermifera MAFF 305830 TaxID=933852 RepID=A0A0C2X619_SERVB|nr:hypothetical protein M408DRAFT_19816 [Serendipita vermifera MAFF 305830]
MDHLDDDSPPALNHAKGRRGPASSSCAECKRLKIRCTGTTEPFPCASCVKRGVASICPNGVMNGRAKRDAGDSDILRRRNQALTARVRALEIELAKAKSTSGLSPAPSGSDRRTDDEETVYHTEDNSLVEAFGEHAPTINLLPLDDPNSDDLSIDYLCDGSLPPELLVIAASFPLATAPAMAGVKDTIRALAPAYDEAVQMAEVFYSYARWLGSPCGKERFMLSILMPLYATKSWEAESADTIALFFGILSVGAMFDQTRPQYDPIAFRLHKLCAASLALSKPLDKPTLTGLEAMQSYLFFHQLSDTPTAIVRLWSLVGVAFRMVYALGIHRDSREWGLDPAQEQRRRLLFWQLNFMDGVIAAAYGRPRFFNMRHCDCPLPDESLRPEFKGLLTWRFKCLTEAMIPVLEEAFSVHPSPTYATVLRLDAKVVGFPPVDPDTLGLDVMTMSSGECMQLFCVGGMKELILLYLHRRFLFEAVSDEQCTDLSLHKYSYSVNAAVKAAIAMTRQTRGAPLLEGSQDGVPPLLYLDAWFLCAVFATIVIKRPGWEQAETAMGEMDSLLSVFEQCHTSKRVRRCLPTMRLLREKAFSVLTFHRAGQTFKVPLDDRLELLIGGPSVAHKAAQTGGTPPSALPSEPSIQEKKMEYDLQALFGSGVDSAGSFNDVFPQPMPAFRPADVQNAQWNTPLNPPNANEMSEIDRVLNGYFNDQQGMMSLGTPSWESLMQGLL